MQSITLAQQERKELIRSMKRERRPSLRLRMHIVLLAADGYRPARIARVLYCSRTTVYTIVERFAREGKVAFYDRKKRGPKPLLDQSANERIEALVEEEMPTAHGWLRSRWSCSLLMVQLFRERAAVVSRETVRRALHRLNFRWRRPRPVPPPKDPKEKRKRLEEILKVLGRERFFFQDETRLETNPRVGFCWMRKGKQKPLRTPRTNRKVWISGALQWSTGRLHWVSGESKNSELFLRLLEHLRRTYRCHNQLHLATDNDPSHTSNRVKEYLREEGKRRIHLHPLPPCNPESNPVELIWWGLHEAVSRNHNCKELDELLPFAERYLEERQPFRLKLGADYRELEESPP